MIIILFHALYLLGKYVYENFHAREDKTDDNKAQNQMINVSEADYADFHNGRENDPHFTKMNIKFFPPVYVQRYNAVHHVLTSDPYIRKIHKVIDFGCAELSFSIHLKNTEGIREIYCVDIDRALLENCQSKVAPLHCDYISLRPEPLTINVCEGSIAHNDNKLANSDAVICIELIEHLYPEDLDAFPYNVFGFIKPLVAIVTTPNADFNVLFDLGTGFRHADHKFEWTRQQFQDWANNIISRYPEYEVSFHGIGAGPGGTEYLGTCSQMAVFHRTVERHSEKSEGIDGLLKTVVTHEYPFRADNRSDEEKILDEAVYYIRLYSARYEDMSEEIPLKQIMFSVEKFCISVEILKSILQEANWAIEDRENGPVVLIPPRSLFSSHSNADYDDFLDNDYRHRDDDDDWGNLETGTPSSGQFFPTYVESDTDNREEEENWDEEPRDNQHSSNSNPNNQNLLNSEPLVSENADRTSDSQWTMEDIINDDLLSDTGQNQPSTTINSSDIETELPSNSLSIELDCTDMDYLNISNDTLDSSERRLSSPFPALDSSETSQSLGTENLKLFSISRNPTPLTKSYKRHLENEETDIDNCIKNTKCLKLDTEVWAASICSSEELKKSEDDSMCDSEDFQKIATVNSPRLISKNSPLLHSNSVVIDAVDENSSISTAEAAVLISAEQTLLMESKDHSLNTEKLLETEEFLDREREKLKPRIDDTSLFSNDKSTLEDYDCLDFCDNSIHTKNMASDLSVKDLSLVGDESYKNIDVSISSIDSSYQKCVTESIDTRLMIPDDIKSQDSMSFKSISNCSIDICPKYTSSPQISVDIHKTQNQGDNNTQQSRDSIYVVPKTIQDTDCTSTMEKTTKELDENFPLSPSRLSLRSNSDISLSTVTSTGSNNVDKWYAAETNPMYKQDIVVLKGGNDTADNPNEDTASDSDAAVSSSDKGKYGETIQSLIETSERCIEYKKKNQTQDNLNTEAIASLSDNLMATKINDDLSHNCIEPGNLDLSSPGVLKNNGSKEETENSDVVPNCRVEGVSNDTSGKTNYTPVPSDAEKMSVTQESREADIYIASKNLGESTKMLEKVDATRQKLETTLATTKKTPVTIHQTFNVKNSTEADILMEIIENVNDAVPNLNKVKELNDKVTCSPSCAEHSIDSRPFGFVNGKENVDLSTFDICDMHVSEQQQQRPDGAVILKEEVSTSFNVSKIAKERNQSKPEFDLTRGSENIESQQFSPQSLDTPPDSWSPEIMDSGYPNSASAHDITPEYELPSIANDRISDSDSASIGEGVPGPGFYENVEVENGDLANNNRDDEGNNVQAFAEIDDIDDLQPLIDVLENDMENENDIYVLQNGFPAWLLRILEMANPIDFEGRRGPQAQLVPLDQAGGDAPNINAENDEGFDSSSSDDDSDIEDDEDDDVTTISSDEMEDPSAEDIRRDWRAGGDP